MHIQPFTPGLENDVVALFANVFGAAEGEVQGREIANLARDLITTTPPGDLFGFVAVSGKVVTGSVFFSRLQLTSGASAFLLSPLAVATACQGTGIGTRLIEAGIQRLEAMGVEWLFTYGDPAYYGRSGFSPVSDAHIVPPFRLSYPHGWLVRPVARDAGELPAASAHCVPALGHAQYW